MELTAYVLVKFENSRVPVTPRSDITGSVLLVIGTGCGYRGKLGAYGLTVVIEMGLCLPWANCGYYELTVYMG